MLKLLSFFRVCKEVTPERGSWNPNLVKKEPQPLQHEERSHSLVQEEPQPPQIKEEQEERALTLLHMEESSTPSGKTF